MIRKFACLNLLKLNKFNNYLISPFSVQKQTKKMAYTVGFKTKNIENIRSLSYKPKQPLKFINGKCLIYKSKLSYSRVLMDYFLYLLGIVTFGFMLSNRMYFDTNPISKHLYIAGIFVMFVAIARKLLRNHNVVKEMYLLQGGKATQVIFQNQLKRKLFGQITQTMYYNSLFFTPAEDKTELIWKPTNLFPETIKQLKEQAQIGSYWKKIYSNSQNFLLIPKNSQFIQPQILVQIMNGKVITK